MTRDELLQALLIERYAPPPPHVWDTEDDYQERVWDDYETTVARRRRVLADIPDGREKRTA